MSYSCFASESCWEEGLAEVAATAYPVPKQQFARVYWSHHPGVPYRYHRSKPRALKPGVAGRSQGSTALDAVGSH